MGNINSTSITFLQCKDCLKFIQTTEKFWTSSTSDNLLVCLHNLYDHTKKDHGYDIQKIAECGLHGSWLVGQQNMSVVAISYYAKELHSLCTRVLDHPEDQNAVYALNSVSGSGIITFLKALQTKKYQAQWDLLLFAMLTKLWSSNFECADRFLTTVLREDYVVFEDGDMMSPSEAKKIFLRTLDIAGDDFFYAYKALDVASDKPPELLEEEAHKIPLATVRKEIKDIVSRGKIIGIAIPEPIGTEIYAKAIFGGCVLINSTRISIFNNDDMKTVARIILAYVHEYAHLKRIIHCSKDDWLTRTSPRYKVKNENEAGEFAIFNMLGLDTQEYVLVLNGMTEELAVFLAEPINWTNLPEVRKRLRILADNLKENNANTEITTGQQAIWGFLAVYNDPKLVARKMGCCMFSPECYKKGGTQSSIWNKEQLINSRIIALSVHTIILYFLE
eukprot:TRINITY_DN13914_c0_g1_i1.p1 TRINITY_DN13914_c0_g1~~TRINITY_DN13914_c0_g1_i1.p1  ORF type:complete len:447 (-),score=22.94 TRINITY_DN13914_c0_g1_i1:125-1465(-)